jgi:hypothetical protein
VSKLADDDLSPVYLRNASAYGLSPRMRFDIVLHNLTDWAFTSGEVLLKSDGTPWYTSSSLPAPPVGPWRRRASWSTTGRSTSGPPARSNRCASSSRSSPRRRPGCRVGFATAASADTRNYRVSCEQAATVFGYATTWDARRSARELDEAYRAIGLTTEEFEGPGTSGSPTSGTSSTRGCWTSGCA